VGDPQLVEMLAAEAERRLGPITDDLDRIAAAGSDSAAVEDLRVEVHGLKGAAMVIGEHRLASLAQRTEAAIAARAGAGTIDDALASRIRDACEAFLEGARAAAAGDPEPVSVAAAEAALPAD
jgi:chemotaxis protein histidine kinase CheA